MQAPGNRMCEERKEEIVRYATMVKATSERPRRFAKMEKVERRKSKEEKKH